MTDVVQQMAELLLKSQLGDVEQKINAKLDEVNTSFEAKLDGLKVELQAKVNELETIIGEQPLQITIGTVETPKRKLVHSSFMKILNILKSQKRIQKNIMLVGEAGSGKTHLASSIAEALNLKFYPMSVGLQTTKSDLLGFINAHGQYVTSPVREAFEKGGVLLLDEFDSTHAGVVTIINSLLANGHCSFPDRIVAWLLTAIQIKDKHYTGDGQSKPGKKVIEEFKKEGLYIPSGYTDTRFNDCDLDTAMDLVSKIYNKYAKENICK